MKSTAIAAIAVIVIIIAATAVWYGTQSQTRGATTTIPSGSGNAKVAYTYSDAAASSVSSVTMQVQQVQMQSSANGQWYSSTGVANQNVQLHGQSSYTLLANASVPAGSYDAVRVMVASATATYANGSTQTIAIPNSTILMRGNFNVQSSANASSTYWINFDINANQSTHSSTNGKLAFYPVINLIAWSNAKLSTGSTGAISVQNYGSVVVNENAGMNLNGTMQLNFVLPQSVNLTISGSGGITIG